MLLFTLLLTSSLTVMAGATVAPALPAITRHFAGVPGAELFSRLVLTLPPIFTAACAPVAGAAIDRHGRKGLLLAAAALYAVGGASGALVDRLDLLLAGRAVLGIAVAGVMTASTALIADLYEGSERQRVMGIQAAFMGLGGVVFLSAGGMLADWSWRGPFLVYLLALPMVALVVRFVPEPPSSPDAAEAVPDPLPPGELPVVVALCAMSFVGTVAFYSIPVQLPYRLELLEGVSRTMTGLALASMTFCGAIASLNYRRLRARLRTAAIFALVFLLMAAGFVVIWRAHSYAMIVAGLVLVGSGTGFFMPNLNVRATRSLPPRLRGRVLGALMTSMFLGQFASPLFTQPVVTRVGLAELYAWSGLVLALIGLTFVATAVARGRRDDGRRQLR